MRVILSDPSPQEVWRAADSDKSRPPTAYFCSGVVVIVMALMINISCSRRVQWKVVVVNTNTFRIKNSLSGKNDPSICELDHVGLFILELNYQTLWDGLCPVLLGMMTSWHGEVIRITDPFHDDVIKWKHFPRHWPFVRGIHGLLWSAPE